MEFGGKPLPADLREQALFYLPDGIRPWGDQPVHGVLAFFEALYGRKRGGRGAGHRPFDSLDFRQTRDVMTLLRTVLNGKKLLDYTLPEAVTGKVRVWSKGRQREFV